MAVFPPEIIGSIVILFIAQKLAGMFSLLHWFVGPLSFWLPPPTEQLKQMEAPVQKRAKKVQSKDKAELVLRKVKVGTVYTRLNQHPFYEEVDTLLFMSAVMTCTYVWIETYACVRATSTFDVGFWCALMGLLWSVYYMLRLLYFQGWKNVEVQISLCLGIPSFVAATLVLFSTTTGFLDMDLQAGFDDANQRTAVLFDKLQMAPSVFSSEDFFRVALAFISTVIAIIFFLPTLRYSRCYNDMLSIHQDEMNISSFDKLLLHMNFVMPFLVAISFVRPMTMDLVLPALVKCNATNKDCHSDPVVEEVFFISESNWRKARFLLLVVMVIVRMILTKKHLQSFLHSAKSVIMASFRRSGAVSADIVSTRLTSQYSYLCVAALQYLSPLLCFGYLALLTLQKGQLDFSICGVINHTLANIGLPESMRRRSPRPFFFGCILVSREL